MDYESAWKELQARVLHDAWELRTINYEATAMLELLAEITERNGGPTFDEQVYGCTSIEKAEAEEGK